MTNTYPSLNTFTYSIAAGGRLEIHRTADFISCLGASSPFKLSIDGQPNTDFQSGLTYTPQSGLKHVIATNEGDAPISVTLAFGKGDIKDNRSAIAGTIDTRPQAPDALTTLAPVSCPNAAATLVLAANSLRRDAILTNTGAGTVFIQGAAGAAGAGLPLGPLATAVLTTGAAIRVRNDTGAAISVAVAELEFSA